MPIVRVNGISVYYEEAGQGRPLVWVHGFACGLRMWDPQVVAFASRYRVVTYDVRGHGASEAPADPGVYSQPHSVEDLYQLLRHLGTPRAWLGGLSMGGNIALNLALAHPEVVEGLIICDTGAGSDDRQQWVAVCHEWADLLEGRGIEAFADVAMAHPLFARYAGRGPEAARTVRCLLTTHRAGGLANTLRGVLAGRPTIYSLEDSLRRLSLPVQLIVGEMDDPCLQAHRFMADVIPGAEHVLIPGVGHLTNLEDPAAFNGAVERFLGQLPGS